MLSTSGENTSRTEASQRSHPPQSMHVDCAVIVVSYNSARQIEILLDSLPAAVEGLTTRCIVIDNNSVDGTVSILRSRRDVALITARRNLGYAGAINVGRAAAGPCSSFLILNPDLVLDPGAVTRMHEALTDPKIGVAVPKLLNHDGGLYFTLRREPNPSRAFGDALFGSHLPGRPGWFSETIRDRRTYAEPRNADWAGGAAMLVSAECDRAVGDWDAERFFLYSEETDFATRARRLGYHLRYVPTARIRHEDGGSGRSPRLGALLAVNRIRYYEKYHRRPLTSLFRVAVALHHLVRCRTPAERVALRAVCFRSSWRTLPGGEREDVRPKAEVKSSAILH